MELSEHTNTNGLGAFGGSKRSHSYLLLVVMPVLLIAMRMEPSYMDQLHATPAHASLRLDRLDPGGALILGANGWLTEMR